MLCMASMTSMASMAAGLILSTGIDFVKQRVVAYLEDRIDLHSDVEEKLKKLERVLNRIQPVANTAEEVDLDKHKDLKPWMLDLNFAVEEAKDVLDEFEYLRLKRQVEGDGVDDEVPSYSKRFKSMARQVIPTFIYAKKSIPSTSTDPLERLKERLRGIQSQLEELDKRALQFLQLVADRKATDREHQIQDVRKRETSSSVVERELVGRRKEMLEEIIRKLLDEEITSKLLDEDEEEEEDNEDEDEEDNEDEDEEDNEDEDEDEEDNEDDEAEDEDEDEEDNEDEDEDEDEEDEAEDEDEDEHERISVIAVVGHGGMGKTTLAQHIFNDTRVKSHFEERMWAHVSQVFDVSTLTKKILESVTKKTHTDSSLEALQQKLKDALKSKRFLLVLDDVWYSQNSFAMEEEWNKLCSPLSEACRKGSKILLTSRTPEVKELSMGAQMPTMISLQGLAPDECWSIMHTIAFHGGEIPDACRDLVQIGKEIAKKVQGSPLAAKAVGGILRKELSLRHWSSILYTEFSKLPGSNIIMAVLKLSYQYLPPHLRQCFAYCSLFPKGHNFDVDMLSRMWVAHGYIRDRPYGEKTEEDVGKSYFDDLLSAGFFTRQIGHFSGVSQMVMHDLMNDLARFVANDEILRIEEGAQCNCPIPKTVRHLSVTTKCLAELNKNKYILSHLETFLLYRSYSYVEFDDKLVIELLQQLRRVRVLNLEGFVVKYLPDDISHWVHLRYLDVSYANINRVPDSLMILYHLQVLKISYEGEFDEDRPWKEICSLEKLNNLVNLRFLDTYTSQFLNLTHVRGLKSLQLDILTLNDLHYIESGDAAREAELDRKNRLQMLGLKWGGECSSDLAKEVLQALQPPKSLKKLYIDSYPGKVCPSWMSIPVLGNLKSIKLSNLFHLECIPPLGQLPVLKRLKLTSLPRVRKLSLGGFPSLKYLTIERMEELEEWSGPDGSGCLPCLEEFSIKGCPKVRKLSLGGLPSLKYSTIESMEELEEWSGPDGSNWLPCLEEFSIKGCPKVRMLPTLSHTVRQLKIDHVGISTLPGLAVDQGIITNSGSSSSSGITSFSSELYKLKIKNCGNLASLGEGLLQNQQRLTHLTSIIVINCEQLVSLPDGGFQELNSLTTLEIKDCPNLTWAAPREDVDRGLLPSSLKELTITDTHIDGNALSRCLQGLSRHLSVTIEGCPRLLVETSSISAADDGEGTAIGPPCPPLALKYLYIDDPQMLVNVPVLKSLTSVGSLWIADASRLISFSPELEEWLLQNGTSLRNLTLWKAGQLQSLPKLPDSLEKLTILDADREFKKRYERDTGCDWYKIRHIKDISIF